MSTKLHVYENGIDQKPRTFTTEDTLDEWTESAWLHEVLSENYPVVLLVAHDEHHIDEPPKDSGTFMFVSSEHGGMNTWHWKIVKS